MLLRAVTALIPGTLLYIVTDDFLYLKLGLLTISLLVGIERCQRSVFLLIMQSLIMAVSILTIFMVAPYPVVFVVLCAVYAYLSVCIGYWGERWRSVGNYIFIPALYCGYSFYYAGISTDSCVRMVALGLLIAVGSVVFATMCMGEREWSWHWKRWPLSESDRSLLFRDALVRVGAVAVTSGLVCYFRPEFGQWVIWSSASVAAGEVAASHHKGSDRIIGALYGLSIGSVLSFFVVQNAYLHAAGMILILLTLVSLKHYRLAFASRCFCIVLTAKAGGFGLGIGLDRFEFVIIGGLVGLAVSFGMAGIGYSKRNS